MIMARADAVATSPSVTARSVLRYVRMAQWVLAGAVAVYVASAAPGVRSHRGYSILFDGWLQNGILTFASLLLGLRVVCFRRDRRAWGGVAAGLALYATGQLIWVLYIQYQTHPRVPSAADFCWLASYAFFYVGVIKLARARTATSNRLLRMDSLVIALGLSAFAMTWLGATLDGTEGDFTHVLTTIAYPVGDLLLLVIVVGSLALQGWRTDRVWVYLGLGLGLFAAADTVYVIRVTNGSYLIGTLLDPTWSVAAAFLVAAAWRPPGRDTDVRNHGWAVVVIPTLFIVAALGLLATPHRGTWPNLVTALAVATVLAGLVRGAFTFREMQTLVINGVEARTDELTGLGNRRAFVEAVERRTTDGGGRFSVLLLDLDRFKEVNDSLGHVAGDQLLHEVGLRLMARMRHGDVLARLGGDEFAILLDNTSPEVARDIGERLRLDLQQAFVSDGVNIYSDASCGVAAWPEAAGTVGGLLQRADIAMYEAKRERLGSAIYAHADEADLTAPLRLVEQLREALVKDQLVLFFQPKVELRTGGLHGVEALVRWQHPVRGLLLPDQFLPQAERYGLMRRLTDRVLAMALDQITEWQSAGLDTTVSVNISAANLLDVGLSDQISTLLAVRNLAPDCLMLEVTETMLMVDPVRTAELLGRLQTVGVRISIDDYGTGYSSLARLRDLPVYELKLDRSFLGGIGRDPRASAIVRSSVELASSLGLVLVVEGIESEEELTILSELRCEIGQGFHFARPMPGRDLPSWVAKQGGFGHLSAALD